MQQAIGRHGRHACFSLRAWWLQGTRGEEGKMHHEKVFVAEEVDFDRQVKFMRKSMVLNFFTLELQHHGKDHESA